MLDAVGTATAGGGAAATRRGGVARRHRRESGAKLARVAMMSKRKRPAPGDRGTKTAATRPVGETHTDLVRQMYEAYGDGCIMCGKQRPDLIVGFTPESPSDWPGGIKDAGRPVILYPICGDCNEIDKRNNITAGLLWLGMTINARQFNPVDDRVNYYEYIKSPEWRARADAAKERAGWRCQVCNAERGAVTLNAHHRTYERLGHEDDGDLTVLCSGCHKLYEDRKRLAKNGKVTA